MPSTLNHKGTLQIVDVDPRGISYQSDTVAKNPVGCVTRLNGNLYRYVLFSTGTGTVASVAGAPCYLKAIAPTTEVFTVTSDWSDSFKVFAGVLLAAAITTATYTWIQIGGVIPIVVNDDTTVKGDRVVAYNDATFTKLAQGTAPFYTTWGALLEDRSATTSGKANALLYPKMVW
jgi:hypothetical protein